jgi:hypothetical protein
MPTIEEAETESQNGVEKISGWEVEGDPEEKPFDPYLYRAEMPFSATHFPMGFPLHLVTNSTEVLEAAQESWGMFEQRFDTPPMRVQVGILDDGSTEFPADITPRALGHLMLQVADSRNFFVTDLLRNFTFAWFATGTILRRNYFRYQMLEAMAMFHIANCHTMPIHAGCVSRNGHGVLLCGDSGAGKSSLSFACARAGWTYTTDDATYLVHGAEKRQVIGNCHILRLRPAAAELFSDIQGKEITQRAKGKPSIELSTAKWPGIVSSMDARVDSVVFLNRRDEGTPQLFRFPKESARRYLMRHCSGAEELRGRQIALLENLLTAEIYELRYRDLDWAVDALDRLVLEGR